LKEWKSFGGVTRKYEHVSAVLGGLKANFCIFLPPDHENKPYPVLIFLSGLTCNEDNFITKAGAQKLAAQQGIAIACPDTSPRGANIPGEDDGWDFGTGAGFYVNATTEGWNKNYKMFDYINKEFVSLLKSQFNTNGNFSITGHSMGGHGSLICFLKNPGLYKSCSAFAPICNPSHEECQWGLKNFTGYLGDENKNAWKEYDACELMKLYDGPKVKILIDQGKADGFLPKKQLMPDHFQQVCDEKSYPVEIRMQEGYDHSYFFISTFIDDHIKHAVKYLS